MPAAKHKLPVLTPVSLLQAFAAPPAPSGLKAAGKRRWEALWESAGWLDPVADAPGVGRLAELEDERVLLKRGIRSEGRTATGSMGQLVTHPLVDQLRAVEVAIRAEERALSLTPNLRARLGLDVMQAHRAAAQMIPRKGTR